MPEGLQYALSTKLGDGPRISVISYEAGPSIFLRTYIEEILTNCVDAAEGDSNKFHVHFLSFSCNVNTFELLRASDFVTTYDFVRNSAGVNIETLHETLLKNVSSKPGRTHIIIVDDMSLFSVLTCSRNVQKQARFLSSISKKFRKLFLFFHKDTLSAEEVGVLYDSATDIAFLQPHPDYNDGGISCSKNKFTCDLLKIRTDRRVTHDKSIIKIINGEIKEESCCDSNKKDGNSESDMLKNLTTFKLTLEDEERESKNKLHLPYFEAQKTSVEDPESFDDFDEDEEDEEI